MKITYVNGDATNPQSESKRKIIVHICNDINAWASGFVVALSKKWDAPEESYRDIPKELLTLGEVFFVQVEDDIMIANMIAQHDIKPENGIPPIRYGALKSCLEKVDAMAKTINADIHMPKIGTMRVGGKWETIVKIIRQTISVDVTVYDLF